MSTDALSFSVSFRLSSPLPEDTVERIADCVRDLLDADLGYSETGGTATMTIEVETTQSDDVDEAVRLAWALTDLGANIADVDDDLVDVMEVANRAGVTHEAARKWTLTAGFPLPTAVLTGGSRLWDWASVNAWLRRHKRDRADESMHLSRLDRARVLVAFRDRKHAPLNRAPVHETMAAWRHLVATGGFAGHGFPLAGDAIFSGVDVSAVDAWLSGDEIRHPSRGKRVRP